MQKHKKRQRTVRLISWGMGTGRRIETAIVTLVLVLNQCLWPLGPSKMALAEEADGGDSAIIIEAAPDEAPEAVVEEEPSVPDAPDVAAEPITEQEGSELPDDEPGLPDANAPPTGQTEEPSLPKAPSTIDVTYKVVRGADEEAFTDPAAVEAGATSNRVRLDTDLGFEDGTEVELRISILLDGNDITDRAEVAPDGSWIEMPAEIDLSKVEIEVTATAAMPEEVSPEAAEPIEAEEAPSAAEEDQMISEQPAEDTGDGMDQPAPNEPDQEASEQPDDLLPDDGDGEDSGEADAEELDGEAIAAQMAEFEAFFEEAGLGEDEQQAFMMQVGIPLLAAAGSTGTITSMRSTGLGDGITAGYTWTLDGRQAYCMSGYFADPVVGQTLTRYSGNLGIKELDYVLYHGYDGVTVTSVGGLNAMRSIAATQAAVWYVVGDKRPDILNTHGYSHNENYYNRLYGLDVIDGRQDIFRAAKALVDAATAYANSGGGGPEAGFAQVYLNDGSVHDSAGYLIQHMAAVGEKTGTLRLVKVSASPSLTTNLACYDLAGAEYGVYTDSSCSASSLAATIRTDTNGEGSATLPAGTYYVKETKASSGFLLDTEVHTVTVPTGGTGTVTSTEQPGNDPMNARVVKRDKDTGEASPQGGGTLAGAEFTLRYYDNTDGDTAGAPTRSWVFATNANGVVLFRSATPISGDEFFIGAGGTRIFPVGTYTIQETKAPEGYILPSGGSEVHTQVVRVAGDGQTVTEMNDIIVDEQVKRGDVRWVKTDDSGRPMANVEFEITSQTTGEKVTVRTDADGVFDSSRASDKRQAWMPHSSTPDSSLGAFPYDTYSVRELRSDANRSASTLLSFTFTIDDSTAGKTTDLGTVENRIVTIGTTLTEDGGTHYVPAIGTVTLTDTISYTNLEVGATYWFEGELYDKESGESLSITAKGTEFIPTKTNGTASMTYEVDAEELAGKTVVCFETLHCKDDDGFTVSHEDIDDVAQTVYFPEIGTTLTGDEGEHEIVLSENIVLTDTVEYTNLEPGKTYTITGELMDKATGKANGITASTTFTPAEKDGEVEVTFTFKGVEVAGKTVVAFETVERDGKTWAVHADIDDENQTVNFPEISTTMVDAQGEHESVVTDETVTLTDTVEYKALRPGEAYTMQAELIDKDTEDVIATAETDFVPEAADGTVDVVFEVPFADVEGKVTVCFETLTSEGRPVAIHADIADEGQTVNFPSGGTTLTDADGNHEVLATESLTLTDTIEYKGLIVGKTYSVRGELMDKETGEATGIVSGAIFTPEASSGTVTVEFTFDGIEMAGHTLVAFETVSRDGRDVIVHADIEDEDQTVTIPKIGTTLTDEEGTKEVVSEGPITLKDTVAYENLTPGRTYVVSGELYDKATNESLGITATAELVPEEADGTVDVMFEIADASALKGRTVVAFETVEADGRTVAVHADIDDVEQTVEFPEIRTKAAGDNGTNRVLAGNPATIVDTVSYTNLVPHKTYTMRGVLHVQNADGTDGGELKIDGKAVTAETTFTPTAGNGTVEMAFTFDASALAGKSVVVFEQCYDGERLVAAHADIADANQTVEVYALPHTGDATDLASASWAAAAGMAMAAIGAYLARVRKEQSL